MIFKNGNDVAAEDRLFHQSKKRRDTEAELKQQGTNWYGMTRAAQNRV